MLETVQFHKIADARRRSMQLDRWRYISFLYREFICPAISWDQFHRQRIVAILVAIILALLLS